MELLVITIPRSDAIDDHQRGEVIMAEPDGFPWSEIEKTHPRAHIIRAPILQSHAVQLLARHSKPRIRNAKPSDRAPTRSHRLDFSKFPNPDEFKGGEGSRSKPIIDLENQHLIDATFEVA